MKSRMQYLLLLAPIFALLSCAGQVPKPEPAAAAKRLVRFTTQGGEEVDPDWSPDGQWIAFESQRSGNPGIWIRPAAGGAALRITDDPGRDEVPKWSPDGEKLLFVSERSGSPNLWIVAPFEAGRPVSQFTTEADSFGAEIANWSPDGEEIVFCARTEGNRDLWIKPVAGGPARRITDRPHHDYAPDWSPDGKWITFNAFEEGDPRELWVVPAAGGAARQLTFDGGNFNPSWSPDSKWIAFCTVRGGAWAIRLIPAAGGEPIDLGAAGVRPRWSPDGRRICYQGQVASGSLWTVSVGGDEPVRLVDDADIGASGGATWSPDGTEVAFVKSSPGGREIWKVEADGSGAVALTSDGRAAVGVASVRWSPDGERIAFVSEAGGQKKVWTVPAAGGQPRAISTTPGEDMFMAWSPDSERLAIASGSQEASDTWIVAAEGGTAERLVSGPGPDTEPDWSPAGEHIAFASLRPRAGEEAAAWNIWTVAATGEEPVWLVEGQSPHWSPDGNELIHVWDNDVWTVPVSGGVPTTLLALNQAFARPRWGPDGQTILYGAGPRFQSNVWIVDVSDVVGP